MTPQIRAFRPLAATQSLSLTTSSQAVAFNWNLGTRSVRICNLGDKNAWIAFGASGVTTATNTGMPLPAGQTEVFTLANDITHYAAIGAAGESTSVIYTTIGEGF